MLIASAPPRPVINPVTLAEMPSDLKDQLDDLDRWALENYHDSRKDSWQYLALKVPAVLASASAGIWAYYQLTQISLFAGVLASVCVTIDGSLQLGMLRNVHERAFHDVRIQISSMVSQWRSRNQSMNRQELASKIIKEAEKERVRIAQYVRDAESALYPKVASKHAA